VPMRTRGWAEQQVGGDPLRGRLCVEVRKSGLNGRNRDGAEVVQNGIVKKGRIRELILSSAVFFRDRACDRVNRILR